VTHSCIKDSFGLCYTEIKQKHSIDISTDCELTIDDEESIFNDRKLTINEVGVPGYLFGDNLSLWVNYAFSQDQNTTNVDFLAAAETSYDN